MAQPAPLCQLERDKFIGNQKGFVDTFNWVVQAVDNLEGGKNCKVDWALDGHPVINVEVPEGGGGGGGGSPSVSAVFDVVSSTSGSQSGIEIQYVDDRAETFIPFPSGGSVTFRGTDLTVTSAANAFNINSASNSNVVVTANGTTLTIGCYYI